MGDSWDRQWRSLRLREGTARAEGKQGLASPVSSLPTMENCVASRQALVTILCLVGDFTSAFSSSPSHSLSPHKQKLLVH